VWDEKIRRKLNLKKNNYSKGTKINLIIHHKTTTTKVSVYYLPEGLSGMRS
jgi:hypothetical protein